MNLIHILLPLYLLISLGYLFKVKHFPSDDFWSGVERLVYYVMFPALIFSNLTRAEIPTQLFGQIFIVVLIPTLIAGASQWLALLNPDISRTTFTSMFQGSVRNNTTIGLIVAGLILPGQGVAVMAVIMTVMVIINNVLCVSVLAHFGDPAESQASVKLGSTPIKIAKNPLILASALGLLINLASIRIADPLHNTIHFLGQAGLPLALLAVGAGLNLSTFSGKVFAIGYSTFAKMILTPVLTYVFVQFISVPSQNAAMFILYGALPTAMASYVLASQLGGDKETMAQIITVQSLATAVAVPLVLLVIKELL